ncbi:NAD(P)/FAD-dependent oxidoreductase [Rhizobium leucaenae]|uniref:Glycine/D-amino acid oxidase-like deaminating enzyme n=1 Tax=Rhizobium leucaenae TaxID=29450 RepID=A0A7W6ZT09_9HYPH|nr:FAD-binding oxidoreductase [Rhizobium leucaenae]MBB4568010.1 glycine/D-amino acid oxidase-like deaminating enzyme [Rhizobium leucaenae]MBB6301275.1 glycine/D-amino acid oxidase-like deaminating enzyme [Rhizobium leucaenae]
MLNDPRSHGLWEKTAPPPPLTRPLDGDVLADVVVVGGGYTGLSSALHLAEAGIKVVLLEANEIGFGGAGRNVGLINAGMWVMPEDLPGVLGPVYGERLLELLGEAPKLVMALIEKHRIACELERNGTLHCAVGPEGLKEIEERARQWGKRGAPVIVLDADETARRVGSSAYAGALLDMRAGTLQPLAYVRGLAHAGSKAGVVIHTGSRVTATEKNGGRWIVRTAGGNVSADWIIVATDAYSTGHWEQVRNEQVHLPYFNFATVPLGDHLRKSVLPGREGAWDTKDILSSFRMDQAGRLVFGSVGALRNTGLAIHKNWARRSLRKLFPQLGDIAFESEWYGKIGMTDNALPRFHRFAPNVVGFSGYNGRGIAPGTVFGKILSDHILGRVFEADLPLPLTDPSEPGFRALKEMWYEAGAQAAHFVGARR